MKKVRITAMRQTIYRDLMEQYENPMEHPCGLEVGQVFLAEGWARPEGFCQSAWDSISPFVLTLACGGEDIYDGWMKNRRSSWRPWRRRPDSPQYFFKNQEILKASFKLSLLYCQP